MLYLGGRDYYAEFPVSLAKPRKKEIRIVLPDGRVFVDPSYDVGAGADDMHDFGTTLQTTATTLIFGNVSGTLYAACMRFTNLAIANASTINTCTLAYTVGGTQTGATCNILIYFEAADNPAAPTTDADFDARVMTTGTAWNALAAQFAGNSVTTPDFSPELQEVVNRAGWASGNAAIVFFKDNASSASANRRAASYENTTYPPPNVTLTATWTEPSGGVPLGSLSLLGVGR